MAKKQTLTSKNPAELKDMLAHEREELRMHRFAAAGARPKDSTSPRKARKQIARLMTELHTRKNAPVSEATAA